MVGGGKDIVYGEGAAGITLTPHATGDVEVGLYLSISAAGGLGSGTVVSKGGEIGFFTDQKSFDGPSTGLVVEGPAGGEVAVTPDGETMVSLSGGKGEGAFAGAKGDLTVTTPTLLVPMGSVGQRLHKAAESLGSVFQ